jgi:3-oxoacyl-[acyl-carrier protein] reductase
MAAERVAFVTGSSRGIGWATARALAADGAIVLINGRHAETLSARVAELRALGREECDALAGDAADAATVGGFYREIFKRFRRLDVLVNNAGVMHTGMLGMIAEADIARTLDANVGSVVRNTQEASRLMARSGGGAIVNVASVVAVRGVAGQSLYAATKAALVGLTLSAARELAPAIRVNAVAPGIIRTEMLDALPAAAVDATRQRVPLGREGTPDEVARVIRFLVSADAAYVTGQVLGVDGGLAA